MREIDQNDPAYIIAMCMAANELGAHGGKSSFTGDPDGILMNIAMLRAGACGWREAEIAFKCPYKERKPRGAFYDARLSVKYAKELDEKADKLCRKVGVSFKYRGTLEQAAHQLWIAFRNLYVEVHDWRVCWLLIALAGTENKLPRLASKPGVVTHGGTPDSVASYNEVVVAEWNAKEEERLKSLAEREMILGKLMVPATEGAFDAHYEADTELMYYASDASDALYNLVNSYKNESQQSKVA